VPSQVDSNFGRDVFLFDRLLNHTVLVSHNNGSASQAGNGESDYASISSDGRYVAFCSLATDLVPGFVDANGPTNADLFLYDRVTGLITVVSHGVGSPTTGGNGATAAYSNNFTNYYQPSLSGDGRYVAFSTYATNLIFGFVPGAFNNGGTDLYLYDRTTGQNAL